MLSILFLVTTFTLRAIGDIQISNPQEAEYASRSIIQELMVPSSSGTETLNLFLGDQTNTDLTLAPVVQEMLTMLPDPSYTVLGNHDRDLSAPSTPFDSTYRANFGAPYYSFDHGNVHFMILNNVFATGRKSYRGHIPQEQLDWLREDVAKTSRKRQMVVAMHIPAYMTDNADTLYQIFEQHQCSHLLILSGHLHQVGRRVECRPSGLSVHELCAGASCGFWWVGERDSEGVPAATMQCGTPRGYFIFDFSRRGYQFRFKGVNRDASQQMSVYVPGIDSLDQYSDTLSLRAVGSVYATVYGACDSTEVFCQLDDGSWVKGKHVNVMDANVARIRQMNNDKIYPTRHNRINPIRRLTSAQVWRFDFDPEQMRGVHRLKIKASDRWGFEAHGDKVYFMK